MSESVEATPEPAGVEVGTDSGPSWKESLPSDLAEHPTIQQTKDIPGMARQLVHAQEMIGRKGVHLPTEGDAEDTDRFYRELGRPDASTDYDFASLRPEGVPWDEKMEGTMAEAFHSAGLSTAQAQKVQGQFIEVAKEQYEQTQQQIEKANVDARNELMKEWGSAYKGNIDLANRAFSSHAGDSMQAMANTTLATGVKLGNWPPFIQFMASIGQKQAEHGLIGDREPRRFTRTPDEAKRQIRKLEADTGFMEAYTDGNNIEHADAVSKMEQLYAVAYAEEG